MPSIYLVLIVLSTVVVNLLIGVYYMKKRKHFFTLYKAEKTKAYFAIARYEMMQMVVEGTVDSKTDFFKTLYYMNTFVMRNPSSYAQISKSLSRSLRLLDELVPAKIGTSSTGQEEVLVLNDSEKKISKLTAEAMSHIIIDYSPFTNTIYKFGKQVARQRIQISPVLFNISIFGGFLIKKNAEKQIKYVHDRLEQIAGMSSYTNPC